MRVPKPKPSTVTGIASHVTVDTSERGLRQTRQQSRGPCSLTGPILVTVDPLQPYRKCTKKTTVTKIVAPRSINKAIIVSRHVGRRYPTTNQRNTKMIVIMMIMILVTIIINIIMSMGLPNTPSRSKHAGGNHPTHTTPQGGGRGGTTKAHTRTTPQHRERGSNPQPHHTTPRGGGGKQRHHTTGGGRGGTTQGAGKQPTTTPHDTTGGGREATHNDTTPQGGGGGEGGGGAGRTGIIYIYMYIYIYICMCMCMCMYVYMYTYICRCICICICTCTCTCAYIIHTYNIPYEYGMAIFLQC